MSERDFVLAYFDRLYSGFDYSGCIWKPSMYPRATHTFRGVPVKAVWMFHTINGWMFGLDMMDGPDAGKYTTAPAYLCEPIQEAA